MSLQRICVFCGSQTGTRPEYVAAAQMMGEELARRGIELVYGGGRTGLMGVVADAVLAGGGRVTGVIPRALRTVELAHAGLQELHVVESMHERKALMAELSAAFIALPGGFGTFEEICEIITWLQLRFISKPCGIVNAAGYYAPLLAQFDRGVTEGFIRPEYRALVREANTPAELLDQLVIASSNSLARPVPRELV